MVARFTLSCFIADEITFLHHGCQFRISCFIANEIIFSHHGCQVYTIVLHCRRKLLSRIMVARFTLSCFIAEENYILTSWLLGLHYRASLRTIKNYIFTSWLVGLYWLQKSRIAKVTKRTTNNVLQHTQDLQHMCSTLYHL